MIETLSVSFSGPAFSLLLYDNLKNKFSQDGFLLGDLVEEETKSITDNDQEQVQITRTIRIIGSVPCPKPHYFYNGGGRINPEQIRSLLGDVMPKVIAWYRFEANTNLNLTFRQKLIHKQLPQLFNVRPEFFTCCLLTSEKSENSSTHSFTQTFMRYNNQKFEQIPMHIVNLSDAPYVYKTVRPVSDTLSTLVKGLDLDPSRAGGPSTVMKIQDALQKHTDQLVEKLAKAEEEMFQLEREVELLRAGSKDGDVTSASNNQVMEIDSEQSASSSLPIIKANSTPKTRKATSPVKKSTPGGREIVTRSMKKM